LLRQARPHGQRPCQIINAGFIADSHGEEFAFLSGKVACRGNVSDSIEWRARRLDFACHSIYPGRQSREGLNLSRPQVNLAFFGQTSTKSVRIAAHSNPMHAGARHAHGGPNFILAQVRARRAKGRRYRHSFALGNQGNINVGRGRASHRSCGSLNVGVATAVSPNTVTGERERDAGDVDKILTAIKRASST
jgi:hypothetical protein